MDEKLFEKMEDYIHGRLSASEKDSFETELEKDEALWEEVALHKKLISSIETESLRQMLDQIHEAHFEEETPVVSMQSRRSYFTWAVAASLALFVLAGWWFFSVQPSQPATLYASYFAPATGLPTTLGYSNSTDFAEGMVSYKLGEYAEARSYWQPLLKAAPSNDTLNYYVGISFLAEEAPAQALGYLEKVAQTESSVFSNDAHWYQALAYLLNEQEEEARAILNELSAEGSAYRKQSLEILEELE
ncbi:tetratricopeptide (TPR) repeat protein [Catalinimonas alkaloidigena]|uniref:hypothetical protein n=1 Tax=Catalinimonas alkaloidigena TaxID=1075417 RepID=UPI00240697F4|nr:hypothetical protein [Catalinimonas alkaloidigena]MDF9795461.1 tetratricopeptide (TPR) repeat protein [Catalinimonas alkaloidigena]